MFLSGRSILLEIAVNWHTKGQGHKKDDPIFQVWESAPAPPTLPVFMVVLPHTEATDQRLFRRSVYLNRLTKIPLSIGTNPIWNKHWEQHNRLSFRKLHLHKYFQQRKQRRRFQLWAWLRHDWIKKQVYIARGFLSASPTLGENVSDISDLAICWICIWWVHPIFDGLWWKEKRAK